MNSDPSDTDAGFSDTKNVIDVFILCKDARDSQSVSEQLTHQGYRVTLFSDSAELLESLHAGKPNLLICDTTDPELEGYEICREIKTDVDLWKIPVLLITGVTSLGDLLIVLDSNADNFIARPYDPQYLFSLIEMMLAAKVEKPDPEKIRTQFKIQHENREYVITTDRRKLLEFLLSSFEIAIDRAGELDQTRNTLNSLKTTLERRVTERTDALDREITHLHEIINEKTRNLDSAQISLRDLKGTGSVLRSQLEEREKVIEGYKGEVSRATQELETTRARLAETEDIVRTLGIEKEEFEQALRGDSEILKRDLEQTREKLKTASLELETVSKMRVELERHVEDISGRLEESEKTRAAQSLETEQLKSTLAGEKSRADATEQEVKSILQEKARAEQELRQMIEDISGKAKQQSLDTQFLADELAKEKTQRVETEQKYNESLQEIAKKTAAFTAEKSTLIEHHDALQQKYDALTASFGAERQKNEMRETELTKVTSLKEQAEAGMHRIQEQLDLTLAAVNDEKRLRAEAEQKLRDTIDIKNRENQESDARIAEIRQEWENLRTDLETTKQERDSAQKAQKDLNDDLAAVALAKAQAEKQVRSIVSERDQIREELETERRLHHTTENKLAEVTQAKEGLLQRRDSREKQISVEKQELLDNVHVLSKELEEEREVRHKLEEACQRISHEKELAEEKIRAVTEEKTGEITCQVNELETLKRELTTALDRQRSLEVLLRDAENEHAEKDAALQALSTEIERMREAHRKIEEESQRISHEKELAEEKIRAVTEEKTGEITCRVNELETLKRELTTALDRQRSLEALLRDAENEHTEKDAALQALSLEIEQAAAALANEKEDRHAAERAYAETKETLAALRRKIQHPSARIDETPLQHHSMIVSKGTDLPAVITHGPRVLSQKSIDHLVPAQSIPNKQTPEILIPDEGIPHTKIRTMEDLFEEPKELDIQDLSDAVPTSNLSSLKENTETPDSMRVEPQSEHSGEGTPNPEIMSLPESDQVYDVNDEEERAENNPDSDAGEPEILSEDAAPPAPSADSGYRTFNRQQWLDLVKWAHNSGVLSHEDRIRFVKLGRLIQNNRRLSGKQEAQLGDLITLAHSMGYRPKE